MATPTTPDLDTESVTTARVRRPFDGKPRKIDLRKALLEPVLAEAAPTVDAPVHTAWEEKLAQLEDTVTRLQADLSAAAAREQALQTSQLEAEERARAASQAHDEVRGENAELRRELQQVREAHQKLAQGNAELERAESAQRTFASAWMQQAEELRAQLQAREAQLVAMRDDHAAATRAREVELAQLEQRRIAEREALSARMGDLQEQLSAQTALVAALQQKPKGFWARLFGG